MRRRNALIILVILISGFVIIGCNGKTGSITTPPASTPTISVVDQANLANQSGGFNAVMKLAVAVEIKTDSPTWDGVQNVLKTIEADSLFVSKSAAYGYGGGYWAVNVFTKVHPGGLARGYHLPFNVVTGDPAGWTLVSASLGTVYSYEPGYPWGYAGISGGVPYSDHAKLGDTYPVWQTDGQYAVHVVRCNTAFLRKSPGFTVSWDDANVDVRDVDNNPITNFVLID